MSSSGPSDDNHDSRTKKGLGEKLRAFTRSAATTGRKFGIHAFGLKPELDASDRACEQLFAQAGSYKETAAQYKGPHNVERLQNLHTAFDDISKFEKELGERESTAMFSPVQDKHRADEYRERLETAWSLFHADITVRQKSEVPMPSVPFPIDKIKPLLPKPIPEYVGHQEELEDHVTLIRDDPSAHTIILGTGGIGKTAMATRVMYDERIETEFGNLRFFIDCDGIVSAEGIMAALASVFNITKTEGAALQEALLQHIRSLHTRILIVFDNLESAWLMDDQPKVDTFLSHICDIDLIAVVVTMRGTSPPYGPAWHRITKLEPLGLQDGHRLFTQVRQQSAAPSDVPHLNELLGLLDGLPLAITLLASVGLTADYKPSELLAAYRSESTSMATRGLGNDPHNSLDVSISVSIKCRTMQDNPQSLSLLALLSLLPDGLRAEDSASALPTMASYPKAARVLVQVALCTRQGETYRVLAPIRAYVQVHYTPDEPRLNELRQYHFKLALRGWSCDAEPLAILAEVEPKMNNIQAVLMHAMAKGSTADAADVLGALLGLSYLSSRMSTGDSKPYLEAALSAYRHGGNSHSASNDVELLLTKCIFQLGEVMRMRGEYEGATAALEEAKAAFQAIGDRLGAAECTQRLGDVMGAQCDYEGATAALEEAKAAFQAIGDRLRAAQCTRTLGDVMRMWDDYEGATGATAALEEAKAAFQAIGDPLGAARCTRSLGDVMCVRGDYEGATEALEEAKEVFQAIGQRLGAAQCTQSLGDVMRMRGDYEGATEALEEAKEVFQAIGHRLGAAQCTRSLGDVMRVRDDYEGATAALEEAKAAFQAIGDRLGAAQCTQSLGDIMRVPGDYEGATAALEEAKEVFQAIGDRLGAAQCTQTLGDVMRVRDDYEGATEDLEEAKAAFQAIGDRLGAAQCTQSLGDVMRERDDYEGATAALEEAKEVFQAIGHRLGAAQCTRSLGDVMRMRGDYEGATAALEEAKEAFQAIGHRLGAAQCTRSLGDVMRMRGDYEGATAALEEAKEAFQAIGDRLGAAQCTQTLGDVMRVQDDYEGATAALEEAKEVFQAIGQRLGAAQCTQSLGDVMGMRGDYEGATEALEEAKAAFQAIGDRLGAAQCTQSLGDVMRERGNYEGATAALEEAKAAFQAIGDRLRAAQCTRTLGDVMRERDDYEGATEALEEAKAEFQATGDHVGAAQCTQSLGDVMGARGDYEGATAALKGAKEVFQAIGDRLGAAQCTQSLGDVMGMRGDYEGATEALEEAKAAFQAIGDRLGAAQCTQSLGDVMRERGNYGQIGRAEGRPPGVTAPKDFDQTSQGFDGRPFLPPCFSESVPASAPRRRSAIACLTQLSSRWEAGVC